VSTESLAVVATGLAVFALAVAVVLVVQLGRLRRAYDALVDGDAATSFPDALARSTAGAHALRTDVQGLRDELAVAKRDLAGALRHVAVVRYDAFSDTGGRLSFSAALLDDAGDGLVLTSINSRSEARTYAKGVQAGGSEHDLSPEERQAIAHATRVRS
jgi:HAMP domain-containing protein